MGCDVGRARRLVREESGQGTVEYALVLFAFLAVVVAFAALWQFFDRALPVEHALQSAPNHIQSASPGAFGDVFMY